MAKLSQPENVRYPPLFIVVGLTVAIVVSQVVKVGVDRTLLPALYTEAEPSAEPLRVTNNDGTLSNGDRLRGWRHHVYFGVYGVLWLTVGGAALAALIRVWPAKDGAPRDT
jgi:hypothetical protein